MQFAPGGTSRPVPVLATTIWGNSASWTLAALPLFIWMGEILFRTRLSEEMFRGLAPWLNWLPGRLMHVNVLACGIFGSVSGSSAATTATVRQDRAAGAEEARLRPDGALGSLAGAGTLGILIPPSIMMVIYAVQANVSIIQVFLAGFIPGFFVMALYSGYIVLWSLANPDKQPPPEPKMPFREKLRESAKLIPTLLLIILVFLSLLMGWATATECAALGRARLARDRMVARHAELAVVLAERDGRDAADLHDHADPGRRVLHVDLDGLHRRAAGARLLGRLVRSQSLRADRRADHHVHPARHRARRHFHDRAHHRGGDPDDQECGLRPGVVRHLCGAGGRDGGGVAAGRLQPVRAADHVRRGFQHGARASLPFFFLLVVAVAIITVFPELVMWLPRLAFPPDCDCYRSVACHASFLDRLLPMPLEVARGAAQGVMQHADREPGRRPLALDVIAFAQHSPVTGPARASPCCGRCSAPSSTSAECDLRICFSDAAKANPPAQS
jgi:TRAP-type uncharacterized transport system fused permease subunit